MKIEIPLIEWVAMEMNCEYVSDLRWLDARQRETLAAKLSKIAVSDCTRREWEDLCEYLTGSKPEGAAEAKAQTVWCLLNT